VRLEIGVVLHLHVMELAQLDIIAIMDQKPHAHQEKQLMV